MKEEIPMGFPLFFIPLILHEGKSVKKCQVFA